MTNRKAARWLVAVLFGLLSAGCAATRARDIGYELKNEAEGAARGETRRGVRDAVTRETREGLRRVLGSYRR